MSKGDIAKNCFENGYNCSQAVVLAFCEDFGLEKETAAMIAAPFGGGIGRLREVCGTFSGINMILGLAEGKNTQENRSKKTELYKDVQALAEKFKDRQQAQTSSVGRNDRKQPESER